MVEIDILLIGNLFVFSLPHCQAGFYSKLASSHNWLGNFVDEILIQLGVHRRCNSTLVDFGIQMIHLCE